MRNWPNLRAGKFKLPDPNTGVVYQNDCNGQFLVNYEGRILTVIASDGLGWEHVSVSLRSRCPTWEEMEFVRELFFRDDETVMQLSVPRSDHVNCHRYCLHLWRPLDQEIPRPPAILVGPVGTQPQTPAQPAEVAE